MIANNETHWNNCASVGGFAHRRCLRRLFYATGRTAPRRRGEHRGCAAAWTAAEQEVFDETREKIDALKADNAALDESINAMEKEIETKLADEDTAYYNTVYEEMQKGVDQVEEYLKGN